MAAVGSQRSRTCPVPEVRSVRRSNGELDARRQRWSRAPQGKERDGQGADDRKRRHDPGESRMWTGGDRAARLTLIVHLDPRVADVAQAPFRVLAKTAPKE